MSGAGWAQAVFRTSVLKQQKWEAIRALLGETQGLRCLDIGADNGIISLLLRQRGGTWTSADLEPRAVESIRALVGGEVHLLGSGRFPFATGAFDRVVIVDALEHLSDDRAFLREVARILRPGGELTVNVPLRKESWLRRARLALGQTDEAHGHVRAGYTPEELRRVLAPSFTVVAAATYSKFFSQLIDTLITWGTRRLKGRTPHVKGTIVTGEDVHRHRGLFRFYAALYPGLWLVAQADRLLWWRSGYLLLMRAKATGVPG